MIDSLFVYNVVSFKQVNLLLVITLQNYIHPEVSQKVTYMPEWDITEIARFLYNHHKIKQVISGVDGLRIAAKWRHMI